jgi:hypothetical protein
MDVEVTDVSRVVALAAKLKRGEYHTCNLMTVIAATPLREANYHVTPLLAYPICTTADGEGQLELLERLQTWWREECEEALGPLSFIASDGDGVRRKYVLGAGFGVTHPRRQPSPPLAQYLGNLPLLDLGVSRVGTDAVGVADGKHTGKRFRTKLIGPNGMLVGIGSPITKFLLTICLKAKGEENFASLFAKNDAQNVPSTTKLLRTVTNLGKWFKVDSAERDSLPPACRALADDVSLLGRIFELFWAPLLDRERTTIQLLQGLAEASHLLIVVYRKNGTHFVPGQLYHDLQSWVRAAFIVAAQTQLHFSDVDHPFFIFQVGTDGLENFFGTVSRNLSFYTWA